MQPAGLGLETLLSQAVDITDPQAREAYLRQACGSDSAKFAELQSMVRDCLAAGSYLDRAATVPPTLAADASNGLGQQIGPYRLRELLGEGGMGCVYVAEQQMPVRRKVALKIIKPGMDTRQVISRFQSERQALALMDHPNIAKVLDAGTTERGLPYFVMELVKGVPITEYCDNQKLSTRQRLQLFIQLCQAVQHAHQKGIIHRDLKPSNVMVTVHDVNPVVKVIDFGVAKAIGSQLTDQTVYTGVHQLIGTPLYMSPEQAGGSGLDVDTRSDVYSQGVLLYELLTGTTPFDKASLQKGGYGEFCRLVREVEPAKPSQRVSTLKAEAQSTIANNRQLDPHKLSHQLSGELDWIVMKAMDKDRERRYQTSSSFAQDLERFLQDQPVLACPPSRAYLLRKFMRRHRSSVLFGGLLLMVLLTGVLGTTVGLWQAQKKHSEAEAQRVLAETREREAIDAVKRFGEVIAENVELKNSPQLQSLRKTLLAEPIRFFQSLRERPLIDKRPESLSRLAQVAYNVGRLTQEIGSVTDSLRAHQEALSLREQLVRNNPSVTKYQDELGRSYLRVAELLSATGKPADARLAYQKALTLFERLAENSPSSQEFQTQFANTYNDLALVLKDMGELTEAVEAYQKALAIREQLAKKNPSNEVLQNHLGESHINIGWLLHTIGRWAEALVASQQAQEVFEQLVEESPTVPRYEVNLAKSYQLLGKLLEDSGKLGEALEACEKMSEIYARLARENPTLTEYQYQLAGSHWSVASVLLRIGKPDEASKVYEQSREIQERLVQENPSVTDFQVSLGHSYNSLGITFDNTGKRDEALAAYKRGSEVFARLAGENPDAPMFRNCLAQTQHNLGTVYAEDGKTTEALEALVQARDVHERLARDYPAVTEYAEHLAKHHLSIGHTFLAAGRPNEALAAYERAQEICERLTEDNPFVSNFKELLGRVYNEIAVLLKDIGKPAEALAIYEQALRVQVQLAEENPKLPCFQSSLGGTLHNIATLDLQARRFPEARSRIQDAISHQKKALKVNPAHPTYRKFLKYHYGSLREVAAGLQDAALETEAKQGLAELAASDPNGAKLDQRLATLNKDRSAMKPTELMTLAERAYDTKRFALAVECYMHVLERDTAQARANQELNTRYKAACCAVLAGTGQGLADPLLDESAKQKLRAQALVWLASELDEWADYRKSGTVEQRELAESKIRNWLVEPDLADVREAGKMVTFADDECDQWRRLWARAQDALSTDSK